jgi:hypothetical protein
MKWGLLTVAILASNMLFAQLQLKLFGEYSSRNNDDVMCDIYFSKRGTYYIEITESLTDDMVFGFLLSKGTYSTIDNDIILTDMDFHYTMQLEYKNNMLYVKKAFEFLKDKVFEFRRWEREMLMKPNNKTFVFQQERILYTALNEAEFPLKFGQYRDNRGGCMAYVLNLSPMGFYWLKYTIDKQAASPTGFYVLRDSPCTGEEKAYLISSGTYDRNGNELILHDAGLQHDFYMLIGKDNIISQLLPMDYQRIVLYYNEL